MGAFFRVQITKKMENTGTQARPFYVKTLESKTVYLFGLKIKQVTIIGAYPDSEQEN